MSDQVVEQLHAWRSERATDALPALDLDAIMARGSRRRRVRRSLAVAVPTVLAASVVAGTLGVIEARTSSRVQPAEPQQVHSTVVEVPPGERVATSAGFEASLSRAGRFCYFRYSGSEVGCDEIDWSSGPLSVKYNTDLDADSSTTFVVYGMFQGTGAADVVVHVPSGDHPATVVRIADDPGFVGFYVELPQLGNEDPTVSVYDTQGQLLAKVAQDHRAAPWNPLSPQEMRGRCQLSSSVAVVGNHPMGC